MGKNSNTKRSKTVVYKYKKKRRDDRIEAGKTFEDKFQVYIIRLIILLVIVQNGATWRTFNQSHSK